MKSLMRATLLLLLLSALATAAPAPLARQKREADSQGWSKPVDSVRARLVAPQTRYRVGETVQLVLEIQNVSSSAVAIEEPDLSYSITSPDDESGGWAITSVRVEKDGRVL